MRGAEAGLPRKTLDEALFLFKAQLPDPAKLGQIQQRGSTLSREKPAPPFPWFL